jgi:hypothetical protein
MPSLNIEGVLDSYCEIEKKNFSAARESVAHILQSNSYSSDEQHNSVLSSATNQLTGRYADIQKRSL